MLEKYHILDKKPEIEKPAVALEYLKSLCEGNQTLEKLLEEMVDYFYRYTATVCEYEEVLSGGVTEEEVNKRFQDIEEIRGIIHNATIDSVNILSRALAKAGKDNSWIQDVSASRATYGKFALTTALSELAKEKGI